MIPWRKGALLCTVTLADSPILNAPARHPRRTLCFALLLAALSLLSVLRLRPETSLKSFFPSADPAAAALDRVFTHFPAADEMLVLATVPGTEPGPQQLLAFAGRLQQEVTTDAEAAKLVASLRYRAGEQGRDFVTHVVVPKGLFYLNDAEFAAAQQRLTGSEMARQLRRNEGMLAAPGPAAGALAKALLQDPLHLHEFLQDRLAAARPMRTYQNSDAFFTEDGRSLLIRIGGAKPPSDMEFCKRLTAHISVLATQANSDGLLLEYSGAYPIAAQSERSIRRDSISSVNGSVACLLLLFIVAFRRPVRLFTITFMPVALGVLYGFGVYAMFSPGITPLTSVIGAMLAGIGIDYAIFYLVHYQERRTAGDAPAEATADTIRRIGGALLAAWVTSVVGFVAIVFASVPALRQFSIVGSLGLAGALLGAVFVLPALLALLDRRAPAAAAPPFRASLRPLIGWIDRRASLCIVVSCAMVGATIASLLIAGPWLGLETDPTVMHPRPNPALDAEAHIARRMGISPDSLIVYLHADSPEQLLVLAYRVNDRLSSAAAKEAGVRSTLGLASLLPDPAVAQRRSRLVGPEYADRVVADFDAALGASDFDPKAYGPYRGFLHRLLTPAAAPGVADLLPYQQLAEELLPRTASGGQPPAEAITLLFMGGATGERGESQASVQTLRGLLADIPGATLTGMSVLRLDSEATIHHDLPRLTFAAVAIVAVYLLLHFRSIPLALLAILPTCCSLACLLAVARIAGAKMNLANIVSAPLLIGIDVDYGIFLVSAARRSATRAELLENVSASARAVILCASATLLGFGSLAFTSVPAVRSLGWAVAIGVSACAVSSLFFLLPLLLWMKDRSMAKVNPKAANALPALLLVALCFLLTGCAAPSGRLMFPDAPMEKTRECDWYDVHHSGHREFGVAYDGAGRVDRLLYCGSDGKVSREYRLADYANERVPHMILLLDSLPFETVRERYDGGDFRWFDPPRKMIAPFPSLTEVCYSDVLHAPPLPGMVDGYYDPRDQAQHPDLLRRAMGYREPWERRLDFIIGFIGQGLSFLHPDEWFAAELEQARLAVEQVPTRVSVIYIASAASMVCAHGRPGAEKVLDGAKRLCLQMLYERRGAIKISMMADHGHNYIRSKNFSVSDMLKEAGFHPADRIDAENDCVVEFSALVTCGGVHTRHPAEVAAALCRHEQVEVAIYQQGARSIIRTARGTAAVECRGHKLRYLPIDADVLGYGPLIEQLKAEGVMDADGYADDQVWFGRTLDHPWPNAPRRVWDALHGRFISPPDVILSLKDGYYSGYPGYERFITMESTHGGLNQVNSATFIMTMTGRLHEAVRHEDVIERIEPGFEPRVHQ
jgi:predicted RND superfamily exporter protein